ncbi:MAG: Ig-like domain-containing protein, partial [Deferrisomatales bacterium]
YTVRDGGGAISNVATVSVTVTNLNDGPLTLADAFPVVAGSSVALNVLANDSDPDGPGIVVGTVQIVTPPVGGTADVNPNGTIQYTADFTPGQDAFTYRVSDGTAFSAETQVIVTVIPAAEALTVTQAEFRTRSLEWRIAGQTNQPLPGTTITIRVGPTLGGTLIGTATADALGVWNFRQAASTVAPDGTNTISIRSTGGGERLAVPVNVRR